MFWKRLGPYRFFSGSTGAAKETPLPVQDSGLEVAEVQYAFKITAVSGQTAQVGLKHKDAPDPDPGTAWREHSAPIAIATPSSTLPATMAGSTDTATDGRSMPYYWPHVVVQESGTPTSLVWVEGYVFVGGRPF